MEEDITTGKLLLAEYDRIKDEQKARIGFRDNLLYVTLAAVITTIIGTMQTGQYALLVVLSAVMVILGWTYLVNDEKISAIGRYIRADLGPRLSSLAGSHDGLFGWEQAHRADSRRAQRKTFQCIVDLTVFVAIPLTALITYWASGTCRTLVLAVSAVETVGMAVLAVQIILYAETGP
ncbi:hypothetical protein ACR820_34060 [Streptomyces netropsis]